MPTPVRPEIIITSERINAWEQIIAYCIGMGYAFDAILSREQRPEDVQELTKALMMAGAIKHIAQEQRSRS